MLVWTRLWIAEIPSRLKPTVCNNTINLCVYKLVPLALHKVDDYLHSDMHNDVTVRMATMAETLSTNEV